MDGRPGLIRHLENMKRRSNTPILRRFKGLWDEAFRPGMGVIWA